jgi:hypothetical protein
MIANSLLISVISKQEYRIIGELETQLNQALFPNNPGFIAMEIKDICQRFSMLWNELLILWA